MWWMQKDFGRENNKEKQGKHLSNENKQELLLVDLEIVGTWQQKQDGLAVEHSEKRNAISDRWYLINIPFLVRERRRFEIVAIPINWVQMKGWSLINVVYQAIRPTGNWHWDKWLWSHSETILRKNQQDLLGNSGEMEEWVPTYHVSRYFIVEKKRKIRKIKRVRNLSNSHEIDTNQKNSLKRETKENHLFHFVHAK